MKFLNFLFPDSPFYCNAIDLNNASVRSLEMELPVDKLASFYVHSEKISEDLNATVDVSCKCGVYMHASTLTGDRFKLLFLVHNLVMGVFNIYYYLNLLKLYHMYWVIDTANSGVARCNVDM